MVQATEYPQRITLLTLGSRGDVQPYVALGKGLQSTGHLVRIATYETFRPFVTEHGLGFFSIRGNPKAILESKEGQAWIASGERPLRFIRQIIDAGRATFDDTMDDCLRAAAEADVVLYHPLAAFAAYSMDETLGIPVIPAYLQHIHPTGAYPFTGVPPRPQFGPFYNWLSYPVAAYSYWHHGRSMINGWRKKAKLPPVTLLGPMQKMAKSNVPFLYGFSQHVVPPAPSWRDEVHLTGYWFLERDPDWQPSNELAAFLQDGPAPVYIGFGSLIHNDMERILNVTLEALHQTGKRGLLLTGWGGMDNHDLPDTVFKTQAVPHDWLFPQVAAVVHHGGAGTASAGFRAGVPTIMIPFYADQPFWAWRAEVLGVGPASVPYQKLSVERLATAIQRATSDTHIRERARTLGKAIREEDGVAQAVSVVNRYLDFIKA